MSEDERVEYSRRTSANTGGEMFDGLDEDDESYDSERGDFIAEEFDKQTKSQQFL